MTEQPKKRPYRKRGRVQLAALDLRAAEAQPQCAKAKLILEYAHDSGSALLKAYRLLLRGRKATRGMTTDEEQDLLRAMLVMAAAGLDGMAKQLIRDALPSLVKCSEAVRSGLETFIQRQIASDAEGTTAATGAKFLARVLAAESQQSQVIEEYIRKLTGGSLQSGEELIRTAKALGLEASQCEIDKNKVQAIFDIRNQIIHELDMNPAGTRRKRHLRKQNEMVAHADMLLGIGQRLLVGVAKVLGQTGATAAAQGSCDAAEEHGGA